MHPNTERPLPAAASIHFQQIQQALAGLHPSQPQYWGNLWRSTQEASRASGAGMECWQNWDDLEDARKYWQRVSAEGQPNARATELLAEVQPGWRVLDIGAGPGNLALPLAAKAAHVTAVEPARGMAQVLRENMAAAGLANVVVVQKRWDDVDAATDLQGPYDLVVVSFAFGMLDLRDALRKILAVASRRVVFYWHAGPQAWDVDAMRLWPLLHGKTFIPIPKAEVIFNLLYAMGIYADVTAIPRSFTVAFDSMEEAMREYRKRYAVPEGDAAKNRLLQQYLQEQLVWQNGQYVQQAQNTGMRISWTVQPDLCCAEPWRASPLSRPAARLAGAGQRKMRRARRIRAWHSHARRERLASAVWARRQAMRKRAVARNPEPLPEAGDAQRRVRAAA